MVLATMLAMTETLRAEFSRGNIAALGDMLHESWMLKRKLASGISSGELDAIYDAARGAGAVGGKLLGAGGGGFFLFDVPEERQEPVATALAGLRRVPFRFESQGARTLYYQQEDAT